MNRKISALIVAAILVSGLFLVCNQPTSSVPAKTYSSADLKLAEGDVTGFTPGTYAFYSSPDSMFDAINGDVAGYTNVAVFTNATIQTSQDNVFKGSVFSFPKEAGAIAVYNDRATRVSDSTTIGAYSRAVVLGDTSFSDAIKIIAHFKNCYFEFTLENPAYGLDRTLAITKAVQFIQAYTEKTSK